MRSLTDEEIDALAHRLTGHYPIGPIGPDGQPEFGFREFPTAPIFHEASAALRQLLTERRALRAKAEALEKAIVKTAIPLEVLRLSDGEKPIPDISPSLRAAIHAGCAAITAALDSAEGK